MSEDQVGLALRMTGFEVQVCRCGEGSERFSNMSYQDPPVASGSGASFPSGGSSSPIPVPPPASQVQGPDVPLPSSGSSSSDKENSSVGSFQSAHTGGKGWCSGPEHHKFIARKWTMYLEKTHPVHHKYIQNFPSQFFCSVPTQNMLSTFSVFPLGN